MKHYIAMHRSGMGISGHVPLPRSGSSMSRYVSAVDQDHKIIISRNANRRKAEVLENMIEDFGQLPEEIDYSHFVEMDVCDVAVHHMRWADIEDLNKLWEEEVTMIPSPPKPPKKPRSKTNKELGIERMGNQFVMSRGKGNKKKRW